MVFRKILLPMALAGLVLQPAACKKSPTTANPPTTTAGISAAFNPATAGPDAVVSFTVTVTANTKEIRSFGGDLSFDAGMFTYQEVAKGGLTTSWSLVDGNVGSPGVLRLAGAVGSGTSVPAGGNGTLVEVKFKVTGAGYTNGQQVRPCLNQFTDDLTQFSAGEACAGFTLKK